MHKREKLEGLWGGEKHDDLQHKPTSNCKCVSVYRAEKPTVSTHTGEDFQSKVSLITSSVQFNLNLWGLWRGHMVAATFNHLNEKLLVGCV